MARTESRYSFGGDEHLFVEIDEEMSLEAFFKSLSVCTAIKEAGIKGVTEICPANASFQVKFDPDVIAPADIEAEVRRRLRDYVYGADDETMAGVVGQLLRAREWSLATGETTTGGALASLITDEIDHPQWYRGGIVAPTGADLARLGVDPDLVAAHGLLSRPVTEALAEAVRRATGADLALALGAVLGPEPVDGQRPGTLHLLDRKSVV